MTRDQAQGNFHRWFGESQVVNDDGTPRAVYHATMAGFRSFQPIRGADTGFHFGSQAQAKMRGGRKATILEVYLSAQRLKRVKDHGKWASRQISDARRAGYDGIVYLNRYEGLTTTRIEALLASGMLSKLDGLSDVEFRRLVPEAEDSFIVFDPTQIKLTSNPGTWSGTDPRLDDGASENEPRADYTNPAP